MHHVRGDFFHALWLLVATTGLRRGELAGLTRNDVDLRARRLLGQKRRLLFVWPDGQPLHSDTITALVHKHCAAAGLPRIRLHDYADLRVMPTSVADRLVCLGK